MLPWLPAHTVQFPPVSRALDQPSGLLAAGGTLEPEWLLAAYRQGIFPWYSDDQPILWWSPDPRTVLFPEELHVSRSLAKRVRNGGFEVTFNHAFAAVVAACSARSEEHTSELQSRPHLVCRLLLEKKKKITQYRPHVYLT